MSEHTVKLGSLNRYEALCALFNNAKPIGLGFLSYIPSHTMSVDEARTRLANDSYVDYLEGRVIKVDFPENATELDCYLYDRDNGEGSAEKAIRSFERAKDYYNAGGLFIPKVYAGSECSVGNISEGKPWTYSILGGTLSVLFPSFTDIPYASVQFSIKLPNNKKYLANEERVFLGVCAKDTDLFKTAASHVIHRVIDDILEVKE